MLSSRGALATLVVLAVTAGAAAGPVASEGLSTGTPGTAPQSTDVAGDPTPAAAGSAPPWTVPTNGSRLERDRQVIEIEVRPDGSARWRVEERIVLEDAADREAFAAVRERVDGNLSYAGAFAERMRAEVAAAASATGREMAVQNVTVRAETGTLPREHGRVVYAFVWDGFARGSGDQVRAGDVLGGFWLGPDTTLLLTWSGGLQVDRVTPSPDERREGALVWRGRMVFSSDGPSVVLDRPAGSGVGGRLPVTAPTVAAAGAVLVAGLLAVVVHRRRRGSVAGDDRAGGGGPAEPTDGADGVGGADDAETATSPAELLSDEERVLALLEDRGGRMKQQALVDEMAWSETKTSEVVQRLRDDGAVEVYRIGRENVLALPGEMDV